MTRWALSVALMLMAAWAGAPAEAKVTTTAKVRYETQAGTSNWYEMEVHFLSGPELNSATKSYRYSYTDKYAVIFFGQGEAAVIELESLFGCYGDFSVSCFPSFGNIEGEDQDGTEWEICTSTFC